MLIGLCTKMMVIAYDIGLLCMVYDDNSRIEYGGLTIHRLPYPRHNPPLLTIRSVILK